jgi:hypothetical protein
VIENILAAKIKERSCFSLSIFLDVSPHMTSRGKDVPIPLCVTEYHDFRLQKYASSRHAETVVLEQAA